MADDKDDNPVFPCSRGFLIGAMRLPASFIQDNSFYPLTTPPHLDSSGLHPGGLPIHPFRYVDNIVGINRTCKNRMYYRRTPADIIHHGNHVANSFITKGYANRWWKPLLRHRLAKWGAKKELLLAASGATHFQCFTLPTPPCGVPQGPITE